LHKRYDIAANGGLATGEPNLGHALIDEKRRDVVYLRRGKEVGLWGEWYAFYMEID
jgi:hypothetical protein